jgi:molecular chaperone GrpE
MPEDIRDGEAPPREAADAAKLEAENQSLRDRLLRALAEAENTRRRAERAAEEARRYANTDFTRELLGVADNLQRAIAAAEQRAGAHDQVRIEGVRATERMLTAIFERFGIRKIEALGAQFDPMRHEAMMEVEDDAHPPGIVVRVLEDGYTINDRLLRPARVAVARSPGTSSSSDESGPGLVPDQNNRHDASYNRDMQSDSDRARNRRGR